MVRPRSLVQLRVPAPAPPPGGPGPGRSSARRAAAGRCPGRGPWRSTPAAAARPTARPAGRSARSARPVMASASPTADSSSDDHCRYQVWCGCRPWRPGRPRSAPRGGRAPAAARRGSWRPPGSGIRSMRLPSSSTSPPDGLSSRPSARSSVDLPHPFGPMIVVDRPGLDAEVEPVDDGRGRRTRA